jgi:hypothetical protein
VPLFPFPFSSEEFHFLIFYLAAVPSFIFLSTQPNSSSKKKEMSSRRRVTRASAPSTSASSIYTSYRDVAAAAAGLPTTHRTRKATKRAREEDGGAQQRPVNPRDIPVPDLEELFTPEEIQARLEAFAKKEDEKIAASWCIRHLAGCSDPKHCHFSGAADSRSAEDLQAENLALIMNIAGRSGEWMVCPECDCKFIDCVGECWIKKVPAQFRAVMSSQKWEVLKYATLMSTVGMY